MTARLEAEEVVVRYGPMRALDGVSLALGRGEIVGLVGPNGSGKSTLLEVLLGARKCDAGEVHLDGVPLALHTTQERARTMTMVSQSVAPDFALRARDVVALGRIPHEGLFTGSTPTDAAAVDAALHASDTTHLAHRALGTLSSGELQRVHLARAFAQQASVVLLDEPTANLDPLHQLTAMRLLRRFVTGGGSALVVLHDLTLAARHCDRLVVIERGRVRAAGPPPSVIGERLLSEVFGVRARVSLGAQGEVDHVLAIEPVRRADAGEES